MDQLQNAGLLLPNLLTVAWNLAIVLMFFYLVYSMYSAMKSIAKLPSLLERVIEKLDLINVKLDDLIEVDSSSGNDDGSIRRN